MLPNVLHRTLQFLHFTTQIAQTIFMMLVLMNLTCMFVSFTFLVVAMRTFFDFLSQIMHANSAQMFNGGHHMPHPVIMMSAFGMLAVAFASWPVPITLMMWSIPITLLMWSIPITFMMWSIPITLTTRSVPITFVMWSIPITLTTRSFAVSINLRPIPLLLARTLFSFIFITAFTPVLTEKKPPSGNADKKNNRCNV